MGVGTNSMAPDPKPHFWRVRFIAQNRRLAELTGRQLQAQLGHPSTWRTYKPWFKTKVRVLVVVKKVPSNLEPQTEAYRKTGESFGNYAV